MKTLLNSEPKTSSSHSTIKYESSITKNLMLTCEKPGHGLELCFTRQPTPENSEFYISKGRRKGVQKAHKSKC